MDYEKLTNIFGIKKNWLPDYSLDIFLFFFLWFVNNFSGLLSINIMFIRYWLYGWFFREFCGKVNGPITDHLSSATWRRNGENIFIK